MDPLNIINFQCWIDVFKKVEPEDLFNLSNVCQLFRNITNDSSYGFSEVEWKFDAILPQLIPYLADTYHEDWSKCGLALKTRLVCKSWLNSIEKILEARDFCPRLTLRTTERIAEFIERFENPPPSPILLRRVCLEKGQGEGDAFHQTAMLFMELFGIQVWDLQISMQNSIFLQLLPFTPNLKSFVYCLGRAEVQLQPFFVLPDLPRLKRFTNYYGNQVGVNYFLRRYGSQLEHLKYECGMRTAFINLSLEAGIHIGTFGALKTLDFEIDTGPNIFPALHFLVCPLEELKIKIISGYGIEELFSTDLFLQSIQHLQQLRHLSIEANSSIRFLESGQLQPHQFSNTSITHLKLNVKFEVERNAFISFNFLESLAQLETLDLTFSCWGVGGKYWKACHAGLAKSIDLLDGISFLDIFNSTQSQAGNDVYESNVWEKVATLEKLELSITRIVNWQAYKRFRFSREEYYAYQWRGPE